MLFIGMAGRGDRQDAEQFVIDHGLEGFRHTFDAEAELWAEFDHYYVPGYLLIDDDGTVTSLVGSRPADEIDAMVAGLVETG